MEESGNKVIYFLKLEPELPKFYFYFSLCCSEAGLSLVPVNVSQLESFIKNKKNILVLCYISNHIQNNNFTKMFNNNLGYSIKSGQTNFYHLSFFYDKSIINSLSDSENIYTNYHFYKLPYEEGYLGSELIESFYTDFEIEKWPGGTSVPLKLDGEV